MRIWIVQPTEPTPLDEGRRLMRAGQLATLLAGGGHDVLWWNSTFVHTSKTFRVAEHTSVRLPAGFELELLCGPGYPSNGSPRRILHNRALASHFRQCARRRSEALPDVVFCSLPPLESAEAAVEFALARRIPVVVDIRDLWPDQYLKLGPSGLGPLLRPLLRLALASEFARARRITRRATALFGISPSYLRWGLELAGRSCSEHDGVYPLGYDSSILPQGDPALLRERFGVGDDKVVALFLGTFGASYDLRTPIEAARRFAEAGRRDVVFVLAGSGEAGDRLRNSAAGLPNVVWTGWLSVVELAAAIRRADIGLATYRRAALQSWPNKVFEYLAGGVPVLACLAGDSQHLIEAERVGLHYAAEDVESFIEAFDRLARDRTERAAMGERAARLVRERFDMRVVYPRMIEHLERLVERSPRGGPSTRSDSNPQRHGKRAATP